jgi:two-component system OmpR family response regulator
MRLLVVEDEPDLLFALAQSLREGGYAVDEASDGRNALFKAQGTDYDAIVLDLMLPGMSGWDILRELRKSRNTPVLILSARGAIADRVKGFESGADDYLTKPFELAELRARLRALIRRAAGVAQTVIHAGDVSVDIAERRVFRDGVCVPLTPREYALVELLVLHKAKLVTRTMIYEHLFDEGDDSLSNLADVHVANVRKKLGRDFIITRRGEGYELNG